MRNQALKFAGIITILVVLDQLSKLYMENHFTFAERLNVFPFFDFILVYNTGAAFSLAADAGGWQRWGFTALAFVACGFILHLFKKTSDRPIYAWALCLIFAGALGNAIDRIAYGHVIDFLLFYWEPWNFYFPAFNFADCFITLGTIGVIIEELFFDKKGEKS